MENKLNHFDQKGNAVMVDVSGKIPTSRTAVAKGKICVCQAVMLSLIHILIFSEYIYIIIS